MQYRDRSIFLIWAAFDVSYTHAFMPIGTYLPTLFFGSCSLSLYSHSVYITHIFTHTHESIKAYNETYTPYVFMDLPKNIYTLFFNISTNGYKLCWTNRNIRCLTNGYNPISKNWLQYKVHSFKYPIFIKSVGTSPLFI